ncbi:MAG: hypothetical protein QNJ13_01350 [Paracoccaceae bacterium]|nr:hypothetical protein [Paracoccaceae bacterium]
MTNEPTPSGNDAVSGWLSPGPDNVKLVYFLYLASLVLGVSGLVGVVLAYVNRNKAGGWVETHYTYQIRTFWIGLLYVVIALALSLLLIGFLLMIAVAVWFIVRCVLGLQRAAQGQPVANPTSWLV